MKFLRPIDGDVLFSVADGTATEAGLLTEVSLSAPAGSNILVNGQPACGSDGVYTCQVLLDAYRNTVEAVNADTGEKIRMVIYWFRNGYRTYRLGVDDVIWTLENIWRNQDTYAPLFDDPFMAMLKELHDQYGTPVHMHIYYENDDGSFNISMFPDKYKAEFQANGYWLKLTFHSLKDKPDSPYKHASYEQVMREGKLVEQQILRFAGPEAMSSITSQHWADSNLHATRAFRNLGYRCIDAYFTFDEAGEPTISYYLNKEQAAHATTRDFWVDNQEDIIFVKDDIIIDTVPLQDIEAHMQAITDAESHAFHYLLVHEEYFYPHYFNYEPDYRERVFAAVDFCHRNGYRPATLSEVALEPRY